MSTKMLGRVEIKDADRGLVDAVFSAFDVVDKDDDVTVKGAFEDGAQQPISAFGHQSHFGSLPVGVSMIRTTDTEAIASGQFFMDTAHGRDTFATVKRLHQAGLGEWSYGYDVLDHSFGEHSGRRVRFLRKLRVLEVSPVLVGAGVGTRTLSAKAGHREEGSAMTTVKTAIRSHSTDVVNRAWDANAVVSAIPDDASVSDLRSVYAWVEAGGDPEAKASYKFPHHHGVGGPANVRACLAGIAVLNGARGGVDVGGDQQGVWNHLAGHLRDADREPPELSAGDGSIKTSGGGDLLSEIVDALVGPQAAIDAVGRLVAPSNGEPRKLSKVKAEYLDWLDEDLMVLHRKLRSYIDSPDDEAVREYVRYVQHRLEGQTP